MDNVKNAFFQVCERLGTREEKEGKWMVGQGSEWADENEERDLCNFFVLHSLRDIPRMKKHFFWTHNSLVTLCLDFEVIVSWQHYLSLLAKACLEWIALGDDDFSEILIKFLLNGPQNTSVGEVLLWEFLIYPINKVYRLLFTSEAT